MNERIREFTLLAGADSKGLLEIEKFIDLEYFAELIVQECADVVKYYHSRNESVTPGQILQHFGVEE